MTRYINGKSSEEPYDEPGDIILASNRLTGIAPL